jgi:hypothetical protein
MRLDHISYVASHDQISDVVNRIGSQIGTAFVDGGIHPKFGTRNFTAPLLNGQYIEVVCPLDHPATDITPFGKLVKQKTEAGGGWMAWVLATNSIAEFELRLGRKAVEGFRQKPDGSTLAWKQIGVNDTIDNSINPFFVEWISKNHPSSDGIAKAEIIEIGMFVKPDNKIKYDEFKIYSSAQFKFYSETSDSYGIKEIKFKFNNQIVILD